MDNYESKVIKSVIDRITNVKKKDRRAPLIEIINDFCVKENFDVLEIGNIISQDETLKSCILDDCYHYNIIKRGLPPKQAW